MGSERPLLISLGAYKESDESVVGGKAAKTAALARAGYKVPNGFALSTWAYEAFIADAGIVTAIRMELDRKSLDEMRWEEIWDTALRLRGLFLAHPLPGALREAIVDGLGHLDPNAAVAVRSSAVGEDSAGRSFAGLHESFTDVRGTRGVEDAVRLVWASLWSDAALLYRKELGLDPERSRMAVLVQEMVDADRSGVAFAADPRGSRRDVAIIEAVPGPCSLLVDGMVDPDRWELNRLTHDVVSWQRGQRGDADANEPLLARHDLERILATALSIEELFRWSPDLEWTGRSDAFTVLQARPITTVDVGEGDKRSWYLTLRPGDGRLQALRRRVVEKLIPELEAEGQALADEALDDLDDSQLAQAIEARSQAVAKWKRIYWDEFIPFAHGVRRLATYYNDAVRPGDPYEFVGLLRDQPLLATQRNRAIGKLAHQLSSNAALRAAVERLLDEHTDGLLWSTFRRELAGAAPGSERFLRDVDDLAERFLDIAYDDVRLRDEPEPFLRNLVEMSSPPGPEAGADPDPDSGDPVRILESRLLEAVGAGRRAEALEVLETGRVSWKLRDDDNLLVARLESQSLRALETGAERLRARARLIGDGHVSAAHVTALVRALREPSAERLVIAPSADRERSEATGGPPSETPRQLVGQPASPGMATGRVRRIRSRDDLGRFRRGEVLVCDAIQPTMTHLVPLASAIVERRGGMLIHGAIIARELGIPCVNGVRGAVDSLRDGDLVTVDGHLGIVTVGDAEFELEFPR
jgi:pyruvate,water dikinase